MTYRDRSIRSTRPMQRRRHPLAPLLAFLLLLASSCLPAMAQGGRSSDNLLYPQLDLPLYIGIEGGYGSWTSSGSFSVGDQQLACAQFADGDGSGITAGARAFIYLNRWLMIASRIRYESRPATFRTSLADEPVRGSDNKVTTMSQQGKAVADLSAISLDAMVGIDIAETGLYVAAGVAPGMMSGGTFDYSEELLSPADLVYGDTGTREHLLAEGRSFENFQTLTIDLRGGIGYLLQLGPVVLNPEVFYSMPMTSALGSPGELKQSGLVGVLGVLVNIGD